MSIVDTQYTVLEDGPRRIIRYRCQDHLDAWHDYGPVISTDAGFDPAAFAATVATRVANRLAEAEAEAQLS